MFLRNYYNQLFSLFSEQTIANGLKQLDGTVVNSACPSSSDTANGIIQAIRGLNGVANDYTARKLVLGSGNTPASVDDYKLESIITTSLSGSVSKSVDDNGNLVIVISVTNTSSAPIIVGEIGIPANCHNESTARDLCLVERTVLDEPITLGAGESCFISYKVNFAPTVGGFPAE